MENEFRGTIESAVINGEVTLTVGEEGLTAVSLFDTADFPYADITAIAFADWAAHIQTDDGPVTVSRLGLAGEPFYQKLYQAYNKKVLKALFAEGAPLLETVGEYRIEENTNVIAGLTRNLSTAISGRAVIQVFENCVCILPPDENARRIPLCFLSGMDQSDWQLTLSLDTGETYHLIRLGYDTTPMARCIAEQLKKLREKTIDMVKAIDPALTPAQASALAKLLPEGAAAPLGQLAAIAPTFADALRAKLAESRAGESFEVFNEICDPAEICVGLGQQLWLIGPGRNGRTAAVEFDVAEGESAATFLYQFDGDVPLFTKQLNRALEAIAFKREVIRLTPDELRLPQYGNYKMAVRRNASLQFIRSCFVGRVIHATPESWRRNIENQLL
ncbi:MAG: PH domain-containing protein [Clostridiales bacterium]|nr:PH domain-containing protein [Clostridiales bacterium]